MSTAARSADAPGSHAVFMRSMSNASHTACARARRLPSQYSLDPSQHHGTQPHSAPAGAVWAFQ